MPELTPRIGIKKPLATDNVTREAFNENWDILDASVAKESDLSAHTIDASKHVSEQERTSWNGKVDAVSLNIHQHSYVLHPAFATAAGTANVVTADVTPSPGGYADGMGIVLKVATQNTGAVTLNVSGLGAKSIRKPNGSALTAGNLKAGSIYTLRYNATTGNFILQGEGGDYGTATADHVLKGYTVGTESGLVEGTFSSVVNVQRGSATISTTASVTVPISPVIRSRSVLIMNTYDSTDAGNNTQLREHWVRGDIVSDTELKFERGFVGGNVTDVTIYWEVVEFRNAVVQRGLTTMQLNAAASNGTISAVDVSKSFIIGTGLTSTGTETATYRYGPAGYKLVNPTTVNINHHPTGSSNYGIVFGWQVVTFN